MEGVSGSVDSSKTALHSIANARACGLTACACPSNVGRRPPPCVSWSRRAMTVSSRGQVQLLFKRQRVSVRKLVKTKIARPHAAVPTISPMIATPPSLLLTLSVLILPLNVPGPARVVPESVDRGPSSCPKHDCKHYGPRAAAAWAWACCWPKTPPPRADGTGIAAPGHAATAIRGPRRGGRGGGFFVFGGSRHSRQQQQQPPSCWGGGHHHPPREAAAGAAPVAGSSGG